MADHRPPRTSLLLSPEALFRYQIGRGNLRATDDLAFKSLDYAAVGGHAAVSVQHVIAARKDLWP